MNRLILIILLFSISCTKFGKNVTVKGRVLNPVTGHGIEGADVKLYKLTGFYDAKHKAIQSATTDASGYFELNKYTWSSPIARCEPKDDLYKLGWTKDGGQTFIDNFELDVKKGKVTQADLFGYPNLAHPTNHFNITPFEAIYCDPQTYQHIKMQQSVDDDGLNDVYLVHTRNFILDEVEADIVYLQNKIIGKNHLNWDPNYRYKAWYKAYDKVVFGSSVTPKTDIGPYIIEPTGEITAYACNGVHLTPGFHAANGSTFHAFIEDDCPNYGNRIAQSGSSSSGNSNMEKEQQRQPGNDLGVESQQENSIQIYPNPSSGEVNFDWKRIAVQEVEIYSSEGLRVYTQTRTNQNYLRLQLKKGIYFCTFLLETGSKITKKVIVL